MSDPKVEWRHYGNYSGPLIRCNISIPIPIPPRAQYHVDRAYWLTTKVETNATFGTVQAYDGCGMTAGPDQHIGVYPSSLAHEDLNAANDQGTLWPLVRRMESVNASGGYAAAVQTFNQKLESINLYLGQDGVLRYKADGAPTSFGAKVVMGAVAHGNYIRNKLTPINGAVPQSGPAWEQAKGWAIAFYNLFSHPDSFKAQVEFGKEDLVKRTKSMKVKSLGVSIELGVYQQEITNTIVGAGGLTPEVDLAMAVYQAHSVNAPAIAISALNVCCAGSRPVLNAGFAVHLLKVLGLSTYGQWNVSDPNGRYQRTRDAAMKSGLWGQELFAGPTAVMPKQL